MKDSSSAYAIKQEEILMEDTAYGFKIVVHQPENTEELEKRVAQAHADAILARVKRLHCSAQQKKDLIDALCS